MFIWIAIALILMWLMGWVSTFVLFGSLTLMAIVIIASLIRIVGGQDPI